MPLVGPTVSTIAYQVLLGGLMLGAHNEYETGLFEITCVFEGAARQPIRLGLLGIAFWVVAAMPPLIMEGLLTFLNGMPTLFAAKGSRTPAHRADDRPDNSRDAARGTVRRPVHGGVEAGVAGHAPQPPAARRLPDWQRAILIFGGAMVLGVGILVALPVILAAGSAAYRDVYG